MRFEFATAGRVVFGPGTASEIAPAARALGRRALMVTGAERGRVERFAAGLECAWFAAAGEPTVEQARQGAAACVAEGCDVVVAIGGGSAIDLGKAIAALAANGGDVLDYLEVVGRGQALERPSLPFIAAPTTAGTGAEVTRNAVLLSEEHCVKASLRSAHMLPRLAVVDPELTHSLPAAATAATGLDALTQLIEPYTSARANPMMDALCVEGVRRVARSLVLACEQPDEATAREDMALASLFGGLALANAGLGAVHGFAAPVGGMFRAPHGAVCAALLAPAMEVNRRALEQRAAGSPALLKYGELDALLGGEAAAWVRGVCTRLGVPGLRAYGVGATDRERILDSAAKASSMKANPIVLTREELGEILDAAL
jgi:alcohol dehydrogenase class IV